MFSANIDTNRRRFKEKVDFYEWRVYLKETRDNVLNISLFLETAIELNWIESIQRWNRNEKLTTVTWSMDSTMSWKALKHENCDQFLMHFYPHNKLEGKLYNDFAMIVFQRKEITISLINDDHLRNFFLVTSTLNPHQENPK